MSQHKIDYYFWPSSDWSYLGHDRFLHLATRAGLSINFKPIRSENLLAQTGGQALLKRAPARQAYRMTELSRWKKALASDIVISPKFFPVDNAAALRLLANASKSGADIAGLSGAVMGKIWAEDGNIADHGTLVQAAQSVGISQEDARRWISDETGDGDIDRNTVDAVSAGVFGAPSYVYEGEVFWGQDRLEHLSQRVSQGIASAYQPSFFGRLEGIFYTEIAGLEMETVDQIELIAGVGVKGDRYSNSQGYYSHKPHEDRQVTLIEQETLIALARDHDLVVQPDETRRNLLTRGVPLNHLVGRTFRVGDVVLRGGRLNVPCKYLERLIDRPVFDPLVHRSGLNCQILKSGTVHLGDTITLLD